MSQARVALVLAPALVLGNGPTWMWFGGYEGAAQDSYEYGAYTWDSANDYCATQGGELCTFDQMCSGGNYGDLDTTTANFWSFPGAMTGDNWAPYRDTQYYWLNTGSARECMQEGSWGDWHLNSWCCQYPFVCCDLSGPSPSPTTATPTVTPAPTAECPYTLTTSGKCLFLSDAYASFQGCETEVCGPASAALVCIASQAENDEVADLLEYDEAWIGYNDGVYGEGEWGWNSGCASTYENWDYGEPNDYCSGEDCATMYSYNGKWNDASCREERRCVCEYGATTTHAFSTWNSYAESTDYECDEWWEGDYYYSDDESCSQEWCTSEGDDCWAGTEDEPCTCSHGKAKVIHDDGGEHVMYTCCTDGSGDGKECNDCCTDHGLIIVIIILIVVAIALITTIVSIAICYFAKCACFAQPTVAPGLQQQQPDVQMVQMGQPQQGVIMQPQQQPGVIVAPPQQGVVVQAMQTKTL